MPQLTVEPSEENLTVLEFLCRRVPGAPSSYLRQLLKKGEVADSSRVLGEGDVLRAGLTVRLPGSHRLQEMLARPPLPGNEVETLFESREILVVNKPAGLAVHAAQGHDGDNLTKRVAELIRRRGDRFRVAPVHRLDLETSGPLLFGKGKKSCAALGKLFMEQRVEKLYLALARGRIDGAGTLTGSVPAKGREKQAATVFRVVAANEEATLVELGLITGRQHQIRRQLADRGHPLFGDRRYGGPCPPGLQRLFSHCGDVFAIPSAPIPWSSTPAPPS